MNERLNPAKPNRILAHLAPDDLDLLRSHLTDVDLPVRQILEHPGMPVEHLYFIERGFASVVGAFPGHREIEVGLVGNEGVTGVAVIMETDRSPQKTYMQTAGTGSKIASEAMREAIGKSPGLRKNLLNYCHTFLIQTANTAMANGQGKIEERLSRWLLMAHDRSEGDEIPLTHEFLATMLSVRRPGVTVALNFLERAGLIQSGRSAIKILDRDGLKGHANGSYGGAETEYARLFGSEMDRGNGTQEVS